MEREQVERFVGIRFIGPQPSEERFDQAEISLKSAMKVAGFGDLSDIDLTGRSFIFLSEEDEQEECVLTGVITGTSLFRRYGLSLTISCQTVGAYRVIGLYHIRVAQKWCLEVRTFASPSIVRQLFGHLAIVTVPTELDELPPLPE